MLQIATGALLHDIGMLKVPDTIIGKEGPLDESELQLMRSHTFYGYKMIVNELLTDEVERPRYSIMNGGTAKGIPDDFPDKISISARALFR